MSLTGEAQQGCRRLDGGIPAAELAEREAKSQTQLSAAQIKLCLFASNTAMMVASSAVRPNVSLRHDIFHDSDAFAEELLAAIDLPLLDHSREPNGGIGLRIASAETGHALSGQGAITTRNLV